MKKKIFKWSIIGLISVLSFSGVSGGVVAFCLTALQRPIYEGELFKSVSLIDSDEYLPTEYEIPQTAKYDNEYFQSLGFEITNNVNIESLGIKKVYLDKTNDDIGSAKLVIEFYKYKTLEISVNNFLDKARWLDIDLNVNELINNSTVSYLYKNERLLINQLKSNDASVSLNQVKYEIKNYDDKQALLILKCSTDTKKRSIRLRTKVDSDTLLKAIVDTSKVSNSPTNLTPSLFHKKYSTIDKIFDLSSLKYFYDSELLTCNPYINDPSRSLIYKLSYNGQTFDYVIEGLYSDYEFNQYTLFNKIKYMTPYEIKFNNYKSLYEPNLSTNLNNLETLGFFDIDKNMNLNNLKISYLNDENKFVLTYAVDKQVFQREFNVQIFEPDNPESAIDSNLTTLLNDFSQIVPQKMELKSDKNSSYAEIRNEIDTIFNDVFLSNIDKTFNNQLSTLLYNFVTEFVSFNTFRRVSNNQGDMKNYLLLLLNSFQLKYESQMVDQQLVFDIQLTIYNHESLNLGELVFPYKETKESETTKNLIIRNNEKLLLNWTNTDLIDGKLNLEQIRTDGILNVGISAFSLRAYYFDNRSRGLNDSLDSMNIVNIAISGVGTILSGISFFLAFAPVPGSRILGIALAGASFVISIASFAMSLVAEVMNFFVPSETAIKYNQPLDLNYYVAVPIWDIYVNGKLINKNESQIIESFNKEIENKHKSTIDMKANIYGLIETIIEYSDPQKRTTNYLIKNDNNFMSSLIKLLYIFSTQEDIEIFYEYLMLIQMYNSDESTLNTNFNAFLSIAINNEVSKLITNQMDLVTKNILQSINNNLLLDLEKFDFSLSPTYLITKMNNIDQYLYSNDFLDYVYDYIYTFSPYKSTDLVNSIVQIVRNEWKNIKNIYYRTFISLNEVVEKYMESNANLSILKQFLQYKLIVFISQKIIYYYEYSNSNTKNIAQLLSSYGLKINSIIPLLRIISDSGNSKNLIPNTDILQILANFIRYENYDINFVNTNGQIYSKKRIIDTDHSVDGPFAHIFRHCQIEIWQVRDMLSFFLTNITDKNNVTYKMSELLRSLNWTYSYSNTSFSVDEKNQTLIVDNLNLRTILLQNEENNYYLNFKTLQNIFNNDNRNTNSSLFVVYDFWPHKKGNKKISLFSNSNQLDFINSKQDYYYDNLQLHNSMKFSYTIENDKLKWNIPISLTIPSISSNLINVTTNNIFWKVQLRASTSPHKQYFLNFMKDFVRGFYNLIYDFK